MIAKTNRWMMAVAVLALASAACNPYPAANDDPPKVVRVFAYSPSGAFDPIINESPVGGAYTLTGLATGSVVVVEFNKPMDGLTIQARASTNPDGTAGATPCAPAANLTVTPATANAVYTCYYPSNPSGGAQMLIHHGASSTDPRASNFTAATTYRVVGNVKDQGGNALPIDINFSTL